MPAHRSLRARRLPHTVLFGTLVALTLLLAGCGGQDDAGPGAGSGDTEGSTGSSTGSPSADDEPAPDPGYGIAAVGDCHRMTAAQSLASVDSSPQVSCRKGHTSVVAYVGYLPRPITPDTPLAKRRALGKRLCEPAYQRLVGGTLADRATSILTWTLFTPGQADLERGARWVRCDVVARSGDQLVRLPAGQQLLAQGVPEQLRICQSEGGIDVSCAERHTFRVEAVYRAVRQAYPAAAAYTPIARARCQQLLGASGGYWQPPSQEGWAAGDRFIRCLRPAETADSTGETTAP